MAEPAPNRVSPADAASVRFFDRTRSAILRRWRDLAARVGTTAAMRPSLPAEDLDRLRQQVDICLEHRGGGALARARAAELGRAYLDLNEQGKLRFFQLLAQEYGVNRDRLDIAIAELAGAEQGADWEEGLRNVRAALISPRIQLLRQFNGLIEGVKFLVDMRAYLIRFAKKELSLRPLESEMRELLGSWFDIGFLELQRITWDAPASLLEKLIDYEAVHEIRSWEDLKDRLDSDRRCYAFFHPAMPHEPLIFVEVALVNGMAESVHELLDRHVPAGNPEVADAAIFYSISNAQQGLAGVSFGDFLIKQVVTDLSHDFPNLKTFATLSPIPGFRPWLEHSVRHGTKLLEPLEEARLNKLTESDPSSSSDVTLLQILDSEDWPDRQDLCLLLEHILMRLAAHYLLEVRRGEQAYDRVAHFHLSNGARLERLNWLADRSPKGLRQSAGIMVNYRYKKGEIEANHERYKGEGRIVAAAAVRNLLR